MNKVLIVAAHPDDEVLGCGGTIARHSDANDEVHILLMTDGVTSRPYDPDQRQSRNEELLSNEEAISLRRKETYRAAHILGVDQDNVYLMNYPDQRLDAVPLLDLIKRVEQVKTLIQPDVVYTHFPNDLNLDHHLTARATLTAFRPAFNAKECPVCHFEVPESTSLSFDHAVNPFVPNHFIDISETLDRKIKALAAYESEKREYPDLRSARYIKEHASKRNEGNHGEYTEAFYINEVYKPHLMNVE